jgi:A nuclease family of the HNH/ENDO VII superfamily with conserved AHH
MTEVAEAVAVAFGGATDHDSTCAFCKKRDPSDPARNRLTNSAPDLRNSLNSKGEKEPSSWKIACVDPSSGKQINSAVRANPHHLIPGNASLKNHPILQLVEEARGLIKKDIGYDVNGEKNGLWLPTIPEAFYGCGAVKPSITWGAMTGKLPDAQYDAAELAMLAPVPPRQFHDAHPDYSNYVKDRLDELQTYIVLQAWNCPESQKDDKAPPPYGLVTLLNGLSARMARGLVGAPADWRDPKFTSRHAEKLSAKMRAAATAVP